MYMYTFMIMWEVVSQSDLTKMEQGASKEIKSQIDRCCLHDPSHYVISNAEFKKNGFNIRFNKR